MTEFLVFVAVLLLVFLIAGSAAGVFASARSVGLSDEVARLRRALSEKRRLVVGLRRRLVPISPRPRRDSHDWPAEADEPGAIGPTPPGGGAPAAAPPDSGTRAGQADPDADPEAETRRFRAVVVPGATLEATGSSASRRRRGAMAGASRGLPRGLRAGPPAGRKLLALHRMYASRRRQNAPRREATGKMEWPRRIAEAVAAHWATLAGTAVALLAITLLAVAVVKMVTLGVGRAQSAWPIASGLVMGLLVGAAPTVCRRVERWVRRRRRAGEGPGAGARADSPGDHGPAGMAARDP